MAEPASGPARDASALTVTVDGRTFEARRGELVIEAAERNGVYIPRFCWHPRMKPVGMCRMCLVEIDGMRGLPPACTTPVANDMVVRTESPAVKKAQDGVLEFLLINHPLDCPVCDRGGECPLQDQTVAFGPGESRFVEEKRHFEKPIPISDLVLLDRERCILCARCTRFADEVAGDPLISFVDRGNQTQVLTFPDEPFRSYFSGNTVQICPVGALLAKPYRFKARPWDLDQMESTCTTCAVGCRVLVQASSDRVVRYLGVDSDPVNHGWLCDKGRFDYEWIAHDDRLAHPLVRKNKEFVEVSWGEALDAAAVPLRRIVDDHGPAAVGVLGGARLTNEDAYAWAKLAKGVLGTDNVDAQLGDGLPAEAVLGLPRATIDEACHADAVILLCADLREELPVLFLRLRAAAVDDGVTLVEASPQNTGLTRHAAIALHYRPGEAAVLARALVSETVAPAAAAGVAADDVGTARNLIKRGSVVVVLGRPSLSESGDSIAAAAAVLAGGIPGVRFLPALRRSNVNGALDMGLSPGLLPGRVGLEAASAWFADAWGAVPDGRGLDATGILTGAANGSVKALVLLGCDPVADFPDRRLALQALETAELVFASDCFLTASSSRAHVVLPAAGYAEKPGTTTNIEGRVTRLGQKVTPPGTARADWMIASELALHLGGELGFESLEGVALEIARVAPAHMGLTPATLARPQHRDGVVVPRDDGADATPLPGPPPEEERAVGEASQVGETASIRPSIAVLPPTELGAAELDGGDRADATGVPPLLIWNGGAPASEQETPLPDAYSLRLIAHRTLYDDGALLQRCSSLAHLAPGARLQCNPYDLDRLGVSNGDRLRVTSPRDSLVVEVQADSGVPRGSAALPFNQQGQGAADLIDATMPATDLRVETLS
jgi:NADH-quinone oxidoreductase subunit G